MLRALEDSAIGAFARDSAWLFPTTEALHLCALAVLGGIVLARDLRLLGIGLTDAPDVERSLAPWFRRALLATIGTGAALFVAEPTHLYGKTAFWTKLLFLAVALLFYRVARARLAVYSPRMTASLSLLSWLAVAWAGRWIGFS